MIVGITTYRKERRYEPSEVYRHGRPPHISERDSRLIVGSGTQKIGKILRALKLQYEHPRPRFLPLDPGKHYWTNTTSDLFAIDSGATVVSVAVTILATAPGPWHALALAT